MYNPLMPVNFYETRVCNSCGLRYPLVEGHPFGTRCPVCMGDTRLVIRRALNTEINRAVKKEKKSEKRLAVLLDNIRSAWNVGSILRSADGFGFSQAYLCGITPTPDHEAVSKTSLGAQASVPWSYHKDAVKLVIGLRVEGWKVYGLEEDTRAVELVHARAVDDERGREVLVVGNEITGIDSDLLDLCDRIFYIPMRGEKKSFNVAIAFGIAAFALQQPTIDH
jgi:23S rRNA (guanosine2251-2'-O)-methyltransferase